MSRNVLEILSEMEGIQTKIMWSSSLINLVCDGIYYSPDSISKDDCNALCLIGKYIEELEEKDQALRDEIYDAFFEPTKASQKEDDGISTLNWLKAIRGKRSQKVIAELSGISQSFYAEIEIGKKRPSVAVAKKIAEVLGFDWVRFFE